MAVIHVEQLSMTEAEQCVAEIWTCLEEYHMPSPPISFEFRHPRQPSIKVEIDDPVAANTMVTHLSTWIRTEQRCVDPAGGPRLKAYTRTDVGCDPPPAAPLSFVLAVAAPFSSSYTVPRWRRK